jgi:Tol biopolymer transport system component
MIGILVSGVFTTKVLRIALLFLFFVAPATWGGDSPGQMLGLSVSPDVRFLATTYVKGNSWRIYKIELSTGNAARLTNATSGQESSPAFSPAGKLIAYSYTVYPDYQRIVVMNVDGSNPRTLPGSGTANLDPTFAPNGEKIYFRQAEPRPHEHRWDLFSIGTDGSNLTQLTHEGFYSIYSPSISPDGKSMVVVTEGWNASAFHRQMIIYSLDHPEKPQRILRPHLPGRRPLNQDFESPNYMPDAKRILFMAATGGKREDDYDVYLVDLKTDSIERLTEGNGYAGGLTLLPDGKTAAFLKWRQDRHGTTVGTDVCLLDLHTRKLTSLRVTGLN